MPTKVNEGNRWRLKQEEQTHDHCHGYAARESRETDGHELSSWCTVVVSVVVIAERRCSEK